MYAIVKTGGKQYRVERGQTLLVERLPAEEGASVALEPILYRSEDAVFDAASLKKVKVTAKVLAHERGEKLRVFKFKPKRGYKRRTGHRQELTRIEVTNISMGTASKESAAKATAKPAAEKAETAKPEATKPTTAKAAAAKPSTDTPPTPAADAVARSRRTPMAHKKGLGSSRNGRDSNAQRLGVKTFAGQTVTGGEIIVRQRGTRFKPGTGVGIGKDDTLYARAAGTLQFRPAVAGAWLTSSPTASKHHGNESAARRMASRGGAYGFGRRRVGRTGAGCRPLARTRACGQAGGARPCAIARRTRSCARACDAPDPRRRFAWSARAGIVCGGRRCRHIGHDHRPARVACKRCAWHYRDCRRRGRSGLLLLPQASSRITCAPLEGAQHAVST